ncbi:hypothetical protein [Paraburkholderia caribensis]|uniref:hypothetical protein n=1 Tax=Paraburkholderia caribensis TaxID=75105 RepID=UPI00078D8C95|nr:hypothetical protein [Paraburkholderia caribensis]AMV47811.1 hypothetical protein ATN79_44905 [Paraburkholderia caribensis]
MVRATVIVTILTSCLVLYGCPSQRITKPADVTAGYIASFRSDLSQFQSDMTDYQKRQQSLISSRSINTDGALATTARVHSELTVLSCKSPDAVLAALQAQGERATTTALAQPEVAASLPSPALPLDKLGNVSTSLKKLSTPPDTKADLEFLVDYGKVVNGQLQTLGKSASKSTP